MAELIDKRSALNALSSASYGNFCYVTARNAIDCVPTTTESEIRAMAISEFAERIKNEFKTEIQCTDDELTWIDEIAEQLKEK